MAQLDLAEVMENMDQTRLVLALIATNPDLDDILPDDPKLKSDVADIRQKIAERHLRFQESPWEISSVVERHVHVHLWDEHTSDRLKALGSAVVDLFKLGKEKVIAAKVQLIDNDTRETISVEDAYKGFKDSLREMVGFMKLDYPIKELQRMQAAALSPEESKDAARVASSAVGDVLDKSLEPIMDKKTVSDVVENDSIWGDVNVDNDAGPDDARYVVRSTTYNSPHYITEKPGINTYTRADAALFSKADAEQLAKDHSSYAASKGYGYRYQVEEATLSADNSLHAAHSPSMSG